MPRFEVDQGSKKRAVADGRRSGHNDHVWAHEKIDLCGPTQPGAQVRVLYEELQAAGVTTDEIKKLTYQTGGEDMPDAYRWSPVRDEDHNVNIVGMFSPDADVLPDPSYAWLFQILWGHVFGLMAAVLNFNRWPRFLQAVGRRLLFVLISLYFDDANIGDLGIGDGYAQEAVQQMFAVFGAPLAAHKCLPMSSSNDFLGLVHNVSTVFQTGQVHFVPRARTLAKAVAIVVSALESDFLSPATASKLRGVVTFLSCGVFGKLGRACQHPLRQRQYSDTAPFTLSFRLRRCLQLLLAILRDAPPRVMKIWGPARKPKAVAPAGRADGSLPLASSSSTRNLI